MERDKLYTKARSNIKKRNQKSKPFWALNNISTFDAENPVIGSLLQEIDIGKKDVLSKILTKAPNPRHIELRSRLDKLINFNNKIDNNNNNNNNFLPPPPPPPLLPEPPRRNDFFQPKALFNLYH